MDADVVAQSSRAETGEVLPAPSQQKRTMPEGQRKSLGFAAAILLGVVLLLGGTIRLIPVETATHAIAEVGQQLNCTNGDDGRTCDISVGFYDGNRHVQAVLLNNDTGEVYLHDGHKLLAVYFSPRDPSHPRELADDESNDALAIVAGVLIIAFALAAWFNLRAKQARDWLAEANEP